MIHPCELLRVMIQGRPDGRELVLMLTGLAILSGLDLRETRRHSVQVLQPCLIVSVKRRELVHSVAEYPDLHVQGRQLLRYCTDRGLHLARVGHRTGSLY